VADEEDEDVDYMYPPGSCGYIHVHMMSYTGDIDDDEFSILKGVVWV